MENLSVDHLLGIKFLNQNDLELIFETADNFKQVINRPIKKVPSLRDITIANLFFENSTRTKLSFELAEKRLSADVLNFSSSQSSVKKGESLIDTVNNILSMKVDMVVIRHSNPGAPQLLSEKVNATIINAGDGAHEHPTQALLDSYSMRQEIGDLRAVRPLINHAEKRFKGENGIGEWPYADYKLAIKALGKFNDQESLDYLIKILTDKDINIRRYLNS